MSTRVRTFGPWWDAQQRKWSAVLVKDSQAELVSCREREVLENFLRYWEERQGRVMRLG